MSLALGGYVDIIAHPNPQRYPNQFVLLVDIDQYAYVAPFVVDDTTIFFKTQHRSSVTSNVPAIFFSSRAAALDDEACAIGRTQPS